MVQFRKAENMSIPATEAARKSATEAARKMRELPEDIRNALILQAGDKVFDLRAKLRKRATFSLMSAGLACWSLAVLLGGVSLS